MRTGRTLAFVVLAILAGGIVSQLPSAMGDDSDPFSALWDAIFDLQSRDDDLQAQIDELRAERDALLVQTGGEPVFVSDAYAGIEVEATEDGRTLVHITAGNSGPDRAAGVKLTAFYLMPLFEINSIDGDMCEDKSRGIIECAIGTLEEDQETLVTVDATARESGEANTWTVDISTTTADSDYANNHVTYDFETGSAERIEIPEVEQPEEVTEENVEEPEVAEPEPEQQDTVSNSTDTNSGSNSTATEGGSSEQPQESAPEEETSDDGAQEEQPAESEDEQVEEQGTSEESGTDESESSDGSEQQEESGEGSEEQSNDESSGSESGSGEESPQ